MVFSGARTCREERREEKKNSRCPTHIERGKRTSPRAHAPHPWRVLSTISVGGVLTLCAIPLSAALVVATRGCHSQLRMPRTTDRKAATAAAVQRLAAARRSRAGGSNASGSSNTALAAAHAAALPGHEEEGDGLDTETRARASRVLGSSDDEDGVGDDGGVESDDLADALAELNVGTPVPVKRGRGKAAAQWES